MISAPARVTPGSGPGPAAGPAAAAGESTLQPATASVTAATQTRAAAEARALRRNMGGILLGTTPAWPYARSSRHLPSVREVSNGSEAGYRLGSDRGSPNHGSTLLSKRVIAQIRSP